MTVVGFVVASVVAERDARRDSERTAEVAAAQIRSRIVQAASLTESLRRFMLNSSGTGVSSDQFARNALRWLSPADFPSAAWVERIPHSQRAAYERSIGGPVVTPDARRAVVPARTSYLPATLVSGFHPLAVPGVDLSAEPEMAEVLEHATRRNDVAATPFAGPRTGPSGLFLVTPAPNLVANELRQGFAVVFVSEGSLRSAATESPSVSITSGGPAGDDAASETFTFADQRFDVAVPREPVEGAAAILPWIILAAGLGVAALAVALGRNSARRARAQADLDRVFMLSNDLIAVASFDGYFTRVNPAEGAHNVADTEGFPIERRWADAHPDWLLGFEDEVWWSRLAPPALRAWAGGDRPLRLVEQAVAKDDPDRKALACYGVLFPATKEVWLRFLDGRPVSAVTTELASPSLAASTPSTLSCRAVT